MENPFGAVIRRAARGRKQRARSKELSAVKALAIRDAGLLEGDGLPAALLVDVDARNMIGPFTSVPDSIPLTSDFPVITAALRYTRTFTSDCSLDAILIWSVLIASKSNWASLPTFSSPMPISKPPSMALSLASSSTRAKSVPPAVAFSCKVDLQEFRGGDDRESEEH